MFPDHIAQLCRFTRGLAQIALLLAVECVAGEVDPGLDAQFIDPKAACRQDARHRIGDVPECSIAMFVQEAINEILSQLRWCHWIGEHHGCSPNVLVRQEAALVAKMQQSGLEGRRMCLREPPVLSQQCDPNIDRYACHPSNTSITATTITAATVVDVSLDSPPMTVELRHRTISRKVSMM